MEHSMNAEKSLKLQCLHPEKKEIKGQNCKNGKDTHESSKTLEEFEIEVGTDCACTSANTPENIPEDNLLQDSFTDFHIKMTNEYLEKSLSNDRAKESNETRNLENQEERAKNKNTYADKTEYTGTDIQTDQLASGSETQVVVHAQSEIDIYVGYDGKSSAYQVKNDPFESANGMKSVDQSATFAEYEEERNNQKNCDEQINKEVNKLKKKVMEHDEKCINNSPVTIEDTPVTTSNISAYLHTKKDVGSERNDFETITKGDVKNAFEHDKAPQLLKTASPVLSDTNKISSEEDLENERMSNNVKTTAVQSIEELKEVSNQGSTHKTLRIVLIGVTGAGKSETGNTILGSKKFKSSPSSKSCTTVCQREIIVKEDVILEVIDTPGLFDTHKPADELRKEFLKCMVMTNPGPHAFLFILKMNRITEQEKKTLKYLKDIFGSDHFLKHTIIVITRKDELQQCDSGTKKTDDEIDELFKANLENSPDLYVMVSQCENRCFLISNKGKVDGPKRLNQADKLLSLIKEMTAVKNGDTFYSYQYFITLEEERKLKLRREAEREEKERRLKRERKQKEKLNKIKERELELKLEKVEMERDRERRRAARAKERLESQLREEEAKQKREEQRRRQRDRERYLELEEEKERQERRRERLRRQSMETQQNSDSSQSNNWGCTVM